jgi:hypothetical protein
MMQQLRPNSTEIEVVSDPTKPSEELLALTDCGAFYMCRKCDRLHFHIDPLFQKHFYRQSSKGLCRPSPAEWLAYIGDAYLEKQGN